MKTNGKIDSEATKELQRAFEIWMVDTASGSYKPEDIRRDCWLAFQAGALHGARLASKAIFEAFNEVTKPSDGSQAESKAGKARTSKG